MSAAPKYVKRAPGPFGKCQECGRYGELRRGWCSKHYQRWVSLQRNDKYRKRFSIEHWNRWLGELNTREPEEHLRIGIQLFRQACARHEVIHGALRDMEIALETQL